MKAKLKTKLASAGAAVVAAAGLACAFPTLAFASEKEGIAVLIPDMNEFIPMLVAFILILIILAKFGWRWSTTSSPSVRTPSRRL